MHWGYSREITRPAEGPGGRWADPIITPGPSAWRTCWSEMMATTPTIVAAPPQVRASLGAAVWIGLALWATFLIVLGGIGTNVKILWYLCLPLIVPAALVHSAWQRKRAIRRCSKSRAQLPDHPRGKILYQASAASERDTGKKEGPLIVYVGFSDFGPHPWREHSFEGEMFVPAVRWCGPLLWLAVGMWVTTAVLGFLPPPAWYMAIVARYVRAISYLLFAVAAVLWVFRRYVRVTELWLYPGRIVVRKGWCLWERRKEFERLDFPMEPGLEVTLFDERPPWNEAPVLFHALGTCLRVRNATSVEIPLRRRDRARFIDVFRWAVTTPNRVPDDLLTAAES